ncbi:hypothetical protein LTR66_009311 [Elasticomyces elasticus]|nr:hypothetical protein LTR66_009311 [Elasticomyces elasticus]
MGIKSYSVPTKVAEYTILPLSIPPLPSFPKPTTHYLYLRPNAPKVLTADTPREVFLVNVPIDATELHIRSLFAEQLSGPRVERVDFEGARTSTRITAPVAPKGKKRKRDGLLGSDDGNLPETWDRDLRSSGGTAVATFVDKTSAELAVKEAKRAAKSGREIVWGKGVGEKVAPLGSARYLTHHRLRYPPASSLQKTVDAFLTSFSAAEAAHAKLLSRQRQVPDEEGFITVTRGGRAGPARLEEATEYAAKQVEKEKEKREAAAGFYRFQTREKRKERAGELLRGFEEDRKKVEEMRKRRKFKPM